MKKILICLLPVLLFVIAYGCSKDHEAPTFQAFKATSNPESVEATYDSGQDVVNINWTMSDINGVNDFVIAVSDSSVFDDGEVRSFPMNLESLTPPFSYVYDASLYVPADVDSLILYYTVSAVYENEIFHAFVGPRAEVDSALVLR